jgi:hypothetical protein
LFDGRLKIDEHEIRRGIKIILAFVVDHPEIS